MTEASGGFVAVLGRCFVCGRVFSYNPHRVPSYDPSHDDPTRPQGREPICGWCITAVNARRAAAGLDPWPVFEDAYDAIPAVEL